MSDGYAINEVGRGGLRIDTVSTTRRAALVNWLVTRKDIPVSANWTDDMIEQMWRSMRHERDFCVKILVSCDQAPGSDVTHGEPA